MAKVFQKCKEGQRGKDPCSGVRCGHPWTVRYREPGGRSGRQREESFDKKGAADAFAAKVEREKDLGTYIEPLGFMTPLVAVYQEFIASGDRVNGTRYQYETSLRLHVEPYFQRKPIGAVKPKDLTAWLRWMVEERGYESSTAVNRYETLSGVFSFAVANDYIIKNPCQHVQAGRRKAKRRIKKTIHLPTLEEIAALAAHLPGPYQLLVWLMAGCGLRIGEASAVSLQQIDFEAGVLYVDRQITQDGENEEPRTRRQKAATKGRGRAHCIRHLKWRDQDEGRGVPIPTTIAAKIRDHIDKYGTYRVETGLNRIEGDYLFSNVGRTNILMYSLVDRLWRTAKRAAGITRKITPHWLRHFFASAGLSKGVPVTDMAEWLGHRDPKITYQTYAHVMPDAPQRLRVVMDSVFTLDVELSLPLSFEALTEAA
ncbi:site-specific recombinase XerD [Streptomyces sp. 3211.6]|uniref:tyrosine-type recombinase/integrase n=1 Tax=Streptomyces sp. 3211.6 TaxID=1938845 RepID=UPI000F1C380D|nr:site-specific integrase [Streptomyces sp. 3211.6]RKT08238.1 site-specific recombinase XerD [Streptomyces sp. 3211.6]